MDARQLKIVEVVSEFEIPEKNTSYIKVKVDTGDLAVFWGTPRSTAFGQKNMKNIELIKGENPPFIVFLCVDEDIEAPAYMARNYRSKFSISEDVLINLERKQEFFSDTKLRRPQTPPAGERGDR